MNIIISRATSLVTVGAAGIVVAAGALAAPISGADGDRTLRAASGYTAQRPQGTLRDLEQFERLTLADEKRVTKSRSRGRVAAESTASMAAADHWIYSADVELFFDADNDGYFRYLRVRFDVDSYYTPAWVFAQLWISGDGESWELYYETDDFRIDGAIPDDEYEVETELLANYPPGSYDVLIEIYDADTGEFAAEYGPAQSSAFALLPLEDADHDTTTPVVVVTEGGGGAASWPLLALLAGAAAARRRKRRRPSVTRPSTRG
jgi:MYXO-CTERM domain-containing protein